MGWMPAYLETMKTAKQELGYQEGAQVEAVIGLRLNQAVDRRAVARVRR